MEIIFLGTSGSIPTKERALPSIAIRLNKLFLFDIGEGTQRQMMKFKVGYGSIESIFISHKHLDHYLGVFGLAETYRLSFDNKRELKLFVPKNLDLWNLNKKPFIKINYIEEGLLWEDKDYEIYAFKVDHVEESFGFLIKEKDKIKFYEKKAKSLGVKGRLFSKIKEKKVLNINGRKVYLKDISYIKKGRKIVYSGDTKYSKNLIKYAENADILIHEATFMEDQEELARIRNHTTVKQAAKIAKEANVKTLVLTHISPRYSEEEIILKEAKKIFSNTIVAKDGLRINLDKIQ